MLLYLIHVAKQFGQGPLWFSDDANYAPNVHGMYVLLYAPTLHFINPVDFSTN